MQPNDNFSVARRALDVEDYIDILRRHRGWIFGPFLFSVVAAVVGVYLWPDSYVSTAVIKITPQQVPESMVQSSINQQMIDRISSMEQEILSRTVLTTIINTFGLYPRERARMPIEDVIEDMRKKVQVIPVASNAGNGGQRTLPAFAVQFSYENRYTAQRVVQDLVSRFIEANLRSRSGIVFQTEQFMKDEFDSAKKDLDAVENKLTEFRVRNNGRLPDQAQGNMQALTSLQTRASTLDSAISRAGQDRLQLEARVRIMKDQLAELNKPIPPERIAAMPVPRNEKLIEVEREITNWEDALRVLRQKYSDNFPDVQTTMGRLTAAKQKREEILKEEAAKKPEKPEVIQQRVDPQIIRERRDLDGAIKQYQSAIEAKDLEASELAKELKQVTESMKSYQVRIENVPLGEKEYGELMRDREIARVRYVELEQKLEKARVSEQMEARKQGENLELLDPPSLPSTPAQPNRPLVISIGAGLGLLLGAVIAGAREMKDTALKNLKDVRAYTQMAILGSIPLLENDFVVRRRRRLAWLGWTTACLAAVVIMSGSVVYYYVSKG